MGKDPGIRLEMDGFHKGPEKLFLLGINYHPSEYGLNYYEEYAKGDSNVPKVIARDFAKMRELGLNSARVFIRLEDFMSERIKDKASELFGTFVEEAEKNDIHLVPCFYGHMSGENTPKLEGSFYDTKDTEMMLSAMKSLVERYEDREIILFWDPSNEPIYREVPEDHDKAYDWAKKVYDGLKASTEKPVVLGDGGRRWITSHERGFHLEELAGVTGKEPCIDSMPVHDYNGGRWTRFKLKLYEGLGPVMLEEFGKTSFSLWKERAEKEQAMRIRDQCYSSLLSGNTMTMPWCWQDFRPTRKPYNYVLKELGFGLYDVKGREKLSAKEYREFIEFVDDVKPQDYSSDARIAVLLPRGAYDPSLNPGFAEDPEKLERQCFEIFSLASKAHLGCDIIREHESLEGYDLLLLPDCRMSDSFVKDVEEFLDEEKTVLSFSPMSISGIKASDKGKITGRKITMGSEAIGVRIKDADYYETDSEAVATLDGKPLMAEKAVGKGKLFTLLCPLDNYLTSYGAMEGDEYVLIDKMAEEAGIEKEFDVGSEKIELGIMRNGEKGMVLLINHSGESIKTKLANPKKRKLKEYKGKDYMGDIDLEFEPGGVKIFEGEWD